MRVVPREYFYRELRMTYANLSGNPDRPDAKIA